MKNPAAALLGCLRNLTVAPTSRRTRWSGVSARCPAEAPIPILLISAQDSDRRLTRRLLCGSRYLLVTAGATNEACKIPGHLVSPVLLYDPPFEAADWQPALRRMIGAWQAPSAGVLP